MLVANRQQGAKRPHPCRFDHEFDDKIGQMAIVGDKRWEVWITKLIAPFYARQARYLTSAALDDAWAWLKA